MEPHQRAFTEHKRCLQRQPILLYPRSNKLYYLFIDASKCCWAAMLCHCTKDSSIPFRQIFRHSVQLHSLYKGSICHLYISIKRLSFHLQSTECTIPCNNKSLNKFLWGKPQNNKANNQSIELSLYKLNIQHMKIKYRPKMS